MKRTCYILLTRHPLAVYRDPDAVHGPLLWLWLFTVWALLFSLYLSSHVCFMWHYWISAGLCLCYDNGSNNFGPVYRFVLPPQVPQYCDNQAIVYCSCCHFVVCRIPSVVIALEPDSTKRRIHRPYQLLLYRLYFVLHHDLSRITPSKCQSGNRPSTSPNSTTRSEPPQRGTEDRHRACCGSTAFLCCASCHSF